jgi:hypothetical protein
MPGEHCTIDERNPTKGGNAKAECGRSHVQWDATLEPTQAQIDDAIAKEVHPRDRKSGKKAKK